MSAEMPDKELFSQSAAQMAAMVRAKTISPVELINAHLARIEELQPALNAFVTVDWDRARHAARAAENTIMRGDSIGSLHGVPVTIKSSISVAGLPCEAGSRLREGAIAHKDAVVVERLKRAGAIILGTTNLPEMLMAYESDNPLYGRVNNPWDLDRTAGGSSGGESAAVAACCSAGGIGSDSGGSVRIPAHFTGICALKATPGRIPGTGHDPQCLGPFSLLGVVGPMTRTITDLEIFYEATAGPDAGDVMADPVPVDRISSEQLRKLRVGYFEQEDHVPVTSETRNAVREAVQALREHGFEVVPFRLKDLGEVRDVWWTFFTLGGATLLRQMYAGHEHEMGPILSEFMAIAAPELPLSGERLMGAWLRRDQLRSQMMEQMQEVPVFISPVCSIPAFRHRERSWSVDGKTVEYLDAMSYTQWFNVLGNPCVVVPVSQSGEGLPIGVQVVARPWQEHVALGIAKDIEHSLGWKQPPLAALSAVQTMRA